jgi:hypothetical protein
MGGGMRALKIATIVMGVLIVLGTTVVAVTIVRRTMFAPARIPENAMPENAMPEKAMPEKALQEKAFAAELDEPAGTAIVGVTSVHDRLAVQLRGGGVDRLLLIDPVSGAVVGRIALAR